MKKQFLVIGTGRFGKGIIKTLSKSKNNIIVACDEKEENLKEIDECVEYSLIGDAKSDEILDELKIREYDVVFVAIGTDSHSSIIVTKKIKDRQAKRIVTKAVTKDVGEILDVVGSDYVVYPEEEAGARIAKKEMMDGVIEYFQLTDNVTAVEIEVPNKFLGKTLIETNLSKETGLNVSLILRDNKPITGYFANKVMKSGDILVIVGEETRITKFKRKYY